MGVDSVERSIIKNARVRSLRGVSDRVLYALKSRGIALIRAAPDKAFVIGSRPVVQMEFRAGLSLFDESTEMWLSVASNLAVGVGRKSVPEVIYDLTDPRPIRLFNLAIAKQSSSFASRSEKLTNSLSKSR